MLKTRAALGVVVITVVMTASWLGCYRIDKRLKFLVPPSMMGKETTTDISNKNDAQDLVVPQDEDTSLTADLPLWLQEYFEWHKQSVSEANLTEANWREKRFIVMSAIRGSRSGGLTDRLRHLPYFLKMAAKTNRILLIYWNKPFSLEHYLLPPEGGLDWRAPSFLVDRIKREKFRHIAMHKQVVMFINSTQPEYNILLSFSQQPDYGESWYNENALEGDDLPGMQHRDIFRSMWHLLFTPAPPIARRISHHFDRMGIVPGEYASAHIRAVYAKKERDGNETVNIAKNALTCASMLRPGGPFFVASDTALAVQAAIDFGRSKNVTVVAATQRAGGSSPLHLDIYNASDPTLEPEDFYDAFVDMYLLGSTRCVAYGQGGFGAWGSLLGFNSSCYKGYWRTKGPPCVWTDLDGAGGANGTSTAIQQQKPLFRRPKSYDEIYSFYR